MTDKDPTKRLQELLDERGVEHETMLLWDGEITKWTVGGYDWKADSGYELVRLILDTLITPEQAVEITLGRDQPIVWCCNCEYFDTRKCKSQWPFRLDGFCAWGKLKEDV